MVKKKADLIREFNLNMTDCDNMASVTAYQSKHIKKLKELVEKYPGEIKIVADDKENDGMLVVHLPVKYCHVNFGERAKREMTDEQKAAAAERMKKAQEAKKAKLEAERMEKEKLEEGWL